ncbi:MAG TPA: hypothetical protein VFL80_03175, partial [Thermoanaerobaculia bacterium]|nr:hypothetical protein [Thermoanaerobaculia bacterium]
GSRGEDPDKVYWAIATHAVQNPLWGLSCQDACGGVARPLWFGDGPCKIAGGLGLATYLQKVADSDALEWASVTTDTWMIVDPFGKHKAGDRVDPGDVIALRHVPTGKYLAADPAKPVLYLSPNTAAWEQWKVVNTSLPAGIQ